MNAGASPTGRAFAVKNCDAFFMQASRVSIAETAANVQKAQGFRARARPGDRRLFRRPGHLPPHAEGGGGVLPARDRRQRRLLRHRPHPRHEEHHAGDARPGGVRAPAPLLRQRHGRAADRSAIPTTSRNRWPTSAAPGSPGIGVSFVNYLAELPFFCDEVIPRLERMGVRERRQKLGGMRLSGTGVGAGAQR